MSKRDLCPRSAGRGGAGFLQQDPIQAVLQTRREEFDAAIDREVQEFDTATAEAVVRAELARGEADQLAARS